MWLLTGTNVRRILLPSLHSHPVTYRIDFLLFGVADSLLLEFELNACELDTLGRFFGCYMSLEARPAFPRLGVMSAPTLHGVSLYVDFARVTAAHVVQKTIHVSDSALLYLLLTCILDGVVSCLV